MGLELDAHWKSIATSFPKVNTCLNMARATFPYRLHAAIAVLFGVLALTFGGLGSVSGCVQDASARVEAVVESELEVGDQLASLENEPAPTRLSIYSAVPVSLPKCGPDGPVRTLGTRAVSLARLPDRSDGGLELSRSPAPNGVLPLGLLALIAGSPDDGAQLNSSVFLPRVQGILETVRSVVLRL